MNINPTPRLLITWICILLMLLYCIISCSPTQRLARLHNRHPEIFTTTTDTIHHNDTINVFVPDVKIDTFFLYQQLKDTLSVEKDGLTTTIWKNADTVFVNSKTDTVTIKVPYQTNIPVQKYNVPQPKQKSKQWLWIIVATAICVAFWRIIQRI